MKLTTFWQRISGNRSDSKNVSDSEANIIHRNEHSISRKGISEHALKVLYRLKKRVMRVIWWVEVFEIYY